MAGGDVFITFGGDTAGLEASLATAKASVNGFAYQLRDLATQMHEAGASAESELGQKTIAAAGNLVQARAAVAAFKEELKGTKEGGETLARVGEGAALVSESFKHLLEIAGIVASLEAFKEWIVSSAELGAQMENVAVKLGVTAQQASQLSGMAQLTDTNFDGLQHTMERFELALERPASATNTVRAGLAALGLSAREFIGVPMPQQLELLSGAMAKFADSSSKTAAAEAILGKSGAELLPFLDKGKQGFEELQAVLGRTGAVMSNEMAAAFAKTHDDIGELSLAWGALSNRIFGVVNPAIDAVIRKFAEMVEGVKVDSLRSGIESFVGGIGSLTASIASFCIGAIQQIRDLISIFNSTKALFAGDLPTKDHPWVGDGGPMNASGGKLLPRRPAQPEDESYGPEGAPGAELAAVRGEPAPVGSPPLDLDHFNQESRESADPVSSAPTLAEQFAQHKAEAESYDASMKKTAAEVTASIKAMFAPPPDPSGGRASHGQTSDLAQQNKPAVPNLDLQGRSGRGGKDAMKDFNDDVQAAQDAAKKTETILDGELKTHQISMQTWLAQTVAALDQEQKAIEAAAAKELARANLTAEQKKQIRAKEAHDVEEVQNRIIAAENKAAEQSAADWKKATDTINSAFTSQINGLLTGTENWRTAFKNVITSMTEDVIKFFADWALKAAENYALQLAQNTGLASAFAAAQSLMTAVESGHFAAAAAGAALEIHTYAGVTGAAVSAYMAPIIGPAAPAAGAAAAAQTLAINSIYDSGSWQIPHDQVAGLHAGEMVIPSKGGIASEFRNFMSGGGLGGAGKGGDVHIHPTQNFHSQSMDSSGVYQSMRNNAPAMGKAMEEAVRHGAFHGLRRLAGM